MGEWQGYKLSERAAMALAGHQPAPARSLGPISAQAVAMTKVKPVTVSPMAMDAQSVFAPYQPLTGVLPEGMAMDSCLPGLSGGLSDWASSSPFHEGQGFFGFPYLAELFQRVEYRHACEIWAEHAVRKWLRLIGGPDQKRKKIEAEFERLGVREIMQTAFLHDQSYGRGQVFLDFDDADKTDELAVPLYISKGKIGPKRPLRRLVNVEPMWSSPGIYATANPLQPNFYKPSVWFVYGRRVHATRMLTMIGKPVSNMLQAAYSFSGQSLIQLLKPYVDNWLRARQAVSDMLNSYSTMVLATDMSSAMGPGATGGALFDRVDMYNSLRDNRACMVIDKDNETLENVAVPLSSVDKLQAQAQEQLASAARIPLSIYLQITPTGLNATSDGETRNFYADVHSYQEKCGNPLVQTILDVVQLSLFDEIDPEIKIEWLPLWEMSDKDKADIRKSDAEADVAYITAGVVSNEETRQRLANDETSLYHGVDLSGPPPEPEPEETPDTDGLKE